VRQSHQSNVAQSHQGGVVSYQEDVAIVVRTRRDEIEADLTLARQLRDRAVGDLRQAERQVTALEALLAYADDVDPGISRAQGARMTVHAAMR
jgi:hypothetical protein